jgi:hypothetical protein
LKTSKFLWGIDFYFFIFFCFFFCILLRPWRNLSALRVQNPRVEP